VRTYAHIPENSGFTLANWIEAIRAGNTFVSSGPLLKFTVNDSPPGSVIHVSKDAPNVHIRAHASCATEIGGLGVIRNGLEQIESVLPLPQSYSAELEFDYPVEESCWLAARCGGLQAPDDVGPRWAHATPITVLYEDKPFVMRSALPVSEAIAGSYS